MRKNFMLATACVAASSAYAGPLDNYTPYYTPSANVETAKKWLVSKRAEYDGAVNATLFTYNMDGYPIGSSSTLTVDGHVHSQTERDIFTWNEQNLCVQANYGDYSDEFAYDVYGRLTAFKQTNYYGTSDDGGMEIYNVRTEEYEYDDTGSVTSHSSKSEFFIPS